MKIKGRKVICTLLAIVMVLCNIAPALANTQDGDSTVYYESTIRPEDIGNYQFKVESHEVPSHEWLPIISKAYFPRTISTFNTEVDNTAPSATYKANTIAKVDVVFAIGQLSQQQQMQNYIPTFTSKIAAASNNIDAYVEQVKTEELDLQNSFKWITDVDSSIGSIDIKNSGRTVDMYGNPRLAGKNAMWIIPEKEATKQEFSFDYNISYGDSFSAAGFMFNIGDTGGFIEGYAVVFGNYSGSFANSTVGVYKIRYKKDTNGSIFGTSEVNLLEKLNIQQSGKLNIDIMKNKAVVTGGGLTEPVQVELKDYYGGGLGFFSEHYRHACNSIGNFSLDNMQLKITNAKSLGEAISDVLWRDNSIRFVIHATDVIPDDMKSTESSDYQYTVVKLLNSNAYLINLGNNINKSTLEELVRKLTTSSNEAKGIFYNNYPITTSMNNAANYIIELAKKSVKPTDYVLVNTKIAWETLYRDQEKDLPLNFGEHDGTKNSDKSDITLASTLGVTLTHLYRDDKIYAEKWRYRHFNTVYDNAPIIESFSYVWIEDPITLFENPGLFRINYKRRDNPFHNNVELSNPFDSYRYWSTDYDFKTKGK